MDEWMKEGKKERKKERKKEGKKERADRSDEWDVITCAQTRRTSKVSMSVAILLSSRDQKVEKLGGELSALSSRFPLDNLPSLDRKLAHETHIEEGDAGSTRVVLAAPEVPPPLLCPKREGAPLRASRVGVARVVCRKIHVVVQVVPRRALPPADVDKVSTGTAEPGVEGRALGAAARDGLEGVGEWWRLCEFHLFLATG